jgi:hypothetical protein
MPAGIPSDDPPMIQGRLLSREHGSIEKETVRKDDRKTVTAGI